MYRINIKHLNILWILLVVFFSQAKGQIVSLPFYYEKNLPLTGLPTKVEEYYYEYHTQAKAHYYNHLFEYDSLSRISKHIKSNVGLLDDIPLTFINIIDPRPVTITYLFEYDQYNRLINFTRNEYQEEVGIRRLDEEWVYDDYHTLVEHNFWEIAEDQKTIKNPSVRYAYQRNKDGQVEQIEKLSYSYNSSNLVLSEITKYGYSRSVLDTISVYQVLNGVLSLKEKIFSCNFHQYSDTNPDSSLLASYFSIKQSGDTIFHSVIYDDRNRREVAFSIELTGDTIGCIQWQYDQFSIIETTNVYFRLEVYFDKTGYETYHEEFQGEYSMAVPADLNTREVENGQIKNALYEIWDPVTYYYRKDTEYLYFYDIETSLSYIKTTRNESLVLPNPSSGTFYLDNLENITEIYLYSTDGKKWKLPISKSITPECPKGLYMLSIKKKDDSIQKIRIVLK